MGVTIKRWPKEAHSNITVVYLDYGGYIKVHT